MGREMRSNLALTVTPITTEEFVIAPAVTSKIQHATHTILSRGGYTNPDGIDISIDALQAHARANQRIYVPTQQIESVGGRYAHTQTYVYNQTTLAIARERVRQGYRVAMLHFVNPSQHQQPNTRRPAQAESLLRSSSVSYCLPDVAWADTAPFYDDTVIVTPQVPVFREHGGDLLMEPWQGSVIHARAIDAHAVRAQMPDRVAEIPQVMLQRAQRILHAAATTRANVLVLGAWGCGHAGHDPAVMAAIWQVAMTQAKVRTFGIIDFAVADIKPRRPTFTSFYQRLHQQQIELK
jgi:uncharacterized protein (TIGR02452 family)